MYVDREAMQYVTQPRLSDALNTTSEPLHPTTSSHPLHPTLTPEEKYHSHALRCSSWFLFLVFFFVLQFDSENSRGREQHVHGANVPKSLTPKSSLNPPPFPEKTIVLERCGGVWVKGRTVHADFRTMGPERKYESAAEDSVRQWLDAISFTPLLWQNTDQKSKIHLFSGIRFFVTREKCVSQTSCGGIRSFLRAAPRFCLCHAVSLILAKTKWNFMAFFCCFSPQFRSWLCVG